MFQKLAIHENFQVGDLTVGPLLTWRHGLQGISFQMMTLWGCRLGDDVGRVEVA